jgi:nucleoside-diphosphate-sugar epimerase
VLWAWILPPAVRRRAARTVGHFFNHLNSTRSLMQCVLVTGGAGFIGSAVVRRLVLGGESRVVNVDRLTYAGNLDSLREVEDHPAYSFHQVDIRDGEALREIFASTRPSAVMHLAAESHVDRSIDGPREFIETNVLGTFTLLEEARRYWMGLEGAEREAFRILHISTDEVFGSLGEDGLFSEQTPYAPNEMKGIILRATRRSERHPACGRPCGGTPMTRIPWRPSSKQLLPGPGTTSR